MLQISHLNAGLHMLGAFVSLEKVLVNGPSMVFKLLHKLLGYPGPGLL